MVIGAMVAMTVAVTTPIAFNINDTAFSLQETLDSIFRAASDGSDIGTL